MTYRNTNHAYQNSAENRDEFDSRIRSGQKKSAEDEATPYTKRKKLSSALDGEKTALDEKKSAYIKAVEERKQEEKRMKMYQSFIEEDTAAYRATADSGILKRLEKTKTRLGNVQKTYTTALERYRKAVAEYDTEVRRYNSLFAKFQDADKKWKAGLRTDLTVINKDLENAGKEREYKGRQLYDSTGLVRAYERSMPKGQQFEQWANVSGARNNIERLDMEDARDIGALQYLLKENQERDIKRLDRRIEELEAEKYYAQTGIYMDREDFEEKAVYKSTANGNGAQIESEKKLIPFGGGSTEWESVSETGFGDILYDYINKNEDAIKLQKEYGVSEIWDFIEQNPHIENMTDDERGVFNYLYHNNRDEALSYVSGLKDDLKNRAVAKREKETREYAKAHPIAASAGTVASAPINALAGLLNAGNYIVTGKINEDAGYNELVRHDKIVREAVSENWGAVGSFAYNVGMGLLDLIVTRKIGKIGGKFANMAKGGSLTTDAINKITSNTTLALMSSRSMADTAVNAKLRGLNDDQAFSLGVIAAATEALTEKYSLEALLDDSVKGWRYIAQNALTEASEETASSAINFMADIGVSKEKSEWIKAIEQYEKSGYSAKEAYGKAFGDQLLSIGLDALGGAISGGVLAGSISLINSASSKIAERRTKENTENAEVFDSVRENIAKQAEERTEQKMATMTKAQPIGAETPVSGQAMGEGAPAPEVQATAQKGVPLRTAEQVMRGEKVMGQTAADMFRQGSAEQAKNTTGNAEYTPEEMARIPQAEKAETETERTGIIYGVAEDNIQAAKRIASTISREVVFYKRRQTADGIMAEDPPEIGGYYNSGDGKIYINANAKDPIARIIAHEMTHSVELADSYNVLFGSILKQIKRSGGKLDSMVADTIARYKAHGETLDDNGAKREIVAEYVAEKLLTDERSIMELAQADQKSANLIMRFVDSLLSKFGTAKTKERAFLRRARKLYAEVLLETTSERNRQAWRDNMRKQLAQLDSDFEAGKISEEAYEKHRDTLEKEISMAGEEYSAEVPQYSISDKEKLAERKEAWYNNANKTTGGANDGREVDNRGRRMGFQETDNGGQTTNSNGYIRKAQGNGKQTGVGIYSGRDTEIHTSDSEGRQIEATLAEKLKDTAVLDADGKPLAVYHFTPEGEFTEFKKGDIGFHFGSKAQAEKRGRDIKAQKGRTFRTYLNIKKPIRARLDIMGWRARPASMYLWTEGYLTDEEHETIKKLSARDDGYYSEAAIQLRKILEEKGYDGIVYPNGFEGDGDSYIAFHDEQIIKTDIDDVTLQSPADSGEPKKQFSIAKNTDGEEALRQEYDARVAEDAYLSDLAEKRDAGVIDGAEFEKRYNDYVSTNPELMELEAKIMRAARDKVRFKKESAQAAGDNTDTQKQDVRKAEKEIFSAPQEVTEKISGQVDLWMRGDMRPDEHFEFGKTPEVLKQLGAQNLPIVMGQSVMVKITGGSHAIALDVIKDIPNAMADPVMVFKSDTVKNAFVILTEHNDKSGDAVVVALHLNKEEKHIRVNRVASIYGKEKVENFIQNQTATGNLKYIDKNKSQAWSQSRGLQLPKLADTNPDNNIILYKENVVNRYIIKKSRKYAQDSENDKKRREGQGKLQFSIGGTATLEKTEATSEAEAKPEEQTKKESPEEVKDVHRNITAARRRMDTVRNKTKLSDTDQAVVEQLLRGEVTPNEIPEESNAKGIMAVYEAKREYESYVRRMQEADMPEAVQRAYDEIPKVRRKLEKAQRKHKLSTDDTMHVGRLLRGEIRPEYLPEGSDIKGITAVYEAKWEYEMYAKEIRDWKHGNAEAMRAEIHKDLSGLHAWRDKKWGLGYSTETMERNFRFVMGDDADGMIAKYITPVHKAAAASNTLKNEMRDRVRALNLSRKVEKGNLVSESHAVQLKGEAEDNIRILEQMRDTTIKRDGKTLQEWKGVLVRLTAENQKMDWKKVDEAIKEFHDIYDTLFRMMNEARVRNGYEPVNYRSGYFPHFQPGEEGVLQHFAKALGIDVSVDALPTSINGMTHMFKPGIQWFGNAQQRLKFNTVYDAVEGFDKYIEGVADVIYQTDNIKRLRALANEIRYLSTEKGIQEQVDEIRGRDNLQDKEKEELIQSILEKGKTKLSNFAVELDEYTNLLANKKSHADRAMEQKFGRAAYDVMRKVNSNVAGSMVSLNITSWITNFIPLTQAWGLVDTKYMARGMWEAFRHHRTPDDIVARSTFLTNRRGSDVLVEMWQRGAQDKNVLQKFGQGWNATIHKLSNGMEHIDTFVSDSIVRARYKQNLDAGMSELAAMDDADAFAASVIADRSKGAMPTIFYQTNPITKMFTQFQLEVKNQFGYFFKDVPREAREKGILVLAAAFTKILFGAWLFNEIFEKLFGRRPALDPIDMAISLFGDTFGFEMPNIFDMAGDAIRGKEISFKAEDEGNLGTATSNLAAGIGEELPFVSGVLPLVLGETFEGGRYPVASALPNLSKIWTEVTDKDKPLNRKGVTVAKELGKPLVYGVLPGGGQVKKVAEGIAAAVQGGSYTTDTKGKDVLQYPVYNDTPGQAVLNGARAMLFGKSTLPTAADWVEGGFKSLSAKDTETYQALLAIDVPGEDAFAAVQAVRKADKSNDKRDAIRISGLSDEAKKTLYRAKISDSRDDEIAALEKVGINFDDFLRIHNEYTTINGQYEGNGATQNKATAFSRWVNRQPWNKAQKDAVREAFVYYSQIPASAGNYNEFMDAGLTDEKAANLAATIGKLTPEDGKEDVSNLQRYRAVATAGLTDKEKMAALSTMMGESEYAKIEIGNKHGISPGTYVLYLETLPKFNTDGNTSYKQEEVEAALNAMGRGGYTLPKADGINRNLTNTQKAVLWQLANKSWKPKNNPYNVSVGTQVYNALKSKD